MSRRDALLRIVGITGSVPVATAILAACVPAATPAPTTAPPTAVPPTTAPTATTAPTVPPTTAPTIPPTAAPTSPMTPTVAATTAPTTPMTPTVPATTAPTAAAPVTATTAPTAPATTAPTTPSAGGPAPHGTVVAADPTIEAAMVEFPNGSVKVMGYMARPKAPGTYPIVLICHENRGLTDHIKDVARRYGRAGYAALAVDLLSRDGGTDKVDAAQVPGVLANAPAAQMVGDFKAGLVYMQTQPFVRKDRAGMVGYCFGGGMTWRCATNIPELLAAVPYYGPNPPLEEVPNIKAAVLAIYGENDARINAGIPAIEEEMKKAGKTFEKIIYPGANHAFNNDTGANYNAAAASDAWNKTLAWFEKYLRA